ncbi:MAG TPA: hypothetical protein VMY42_15205 [Thermoguttaceae bacterium]|nr:hypothetical protein [Thermoguttaceae bacterium]
MPWYRWARELSLAYGWTPQQIGRLSIAQIWIYLTEASGPGGRKRMAPADARTLCRLRQRDRQAWIDRTMEEWNRGK